MLCDSSVQQVTAVGSLHGAARYLTTAAGPPGSLATGSTQGFWAGLSRQEATLAAALSCSVSAQSRRTEDGGCSWARQEHFCRLSGPAQLRAPRSHFLEILQTGILHK